MKPTITTLTESKRGCGYRQPGGLYLITMPNVLVPCGKLPLPLHRCPTCGGGLKQTRSFQWVDPLPLFGGVSCSEVSGTPCGSDPHGDVTCVLAESPLGDVDGHACLNIGDKVGLLWIGAEFYPEPADWIAEAQSLGVSRRVRTIPRGFEIGTHWILVAHPKAMYYRCDDCMGAGTTPIPDGGGVRLCDNCNGTQHVNGPGIFHAFKPTGIDYVVKDDDTDEDLLAMQKRGVRLVRVKPAKEEPELETVATQ